MQTSPPAGAHAETARNAILAAGGQISQTSLLSLLGATGSQG
ncbi:MAG: hypothetical protein ACRD1L_11330 [Terriglobales bacterium]